jgi:hypothetical protein
MASHVDDPTLETPGNYTTTRDVTRSRHVVLAAWRESPRMKTRTSNCYG